MASASRGAYACPDIPVQPELHAAAAWWYFEFVETAEEGTGVVLLGSVAGEIQVLD